MVDGSERRDFLTIDGGERPSSPARLIVCERSGRWATALRRELRGSGVRVWETRLLDDCWQELTESPASFVILELSGRLPSLLRGMVRMARTFPLSRTAVVADRHFRGHEWLMREAGAVWFTSSPRRIATLAQLACRHLLEVPPPPQSLTERIWAGLPWEVEGERPDYSVSSQPPGALC